MVSDPSGAGKSSALNTTIRVIFFILALVSGAIMPSAGVKLIALGGSWYYLLAGLAHIFFAFLFLRNNPRSAPLPTLAFFCTTLVSLF